MLDYGARTERKRRMPRVLAYVIFWGLVLWIGARAFLPSRGPVLSPVPEDPRVSIIAALFSREKKPEDLKRKIQDAAKDWTNYSVLVADYTSPFRMEINETVIYTAASVNKLPILAALYYYAQAGDIDLDEVITIQPADVQNYGTGSIQYDPPGTTYSIKTLAKLMIQKSDNTAAYVLTNHIVGAVKIQELMKSWGLTQTDTLKDNKTSNRDMAVLMEKLYTGKIANEAATLEMLGFLKDSDFEDRLPALLPDGVTVYHKIGTETRVIHDVGVVTDGKATYYIGVFTNEVTNEEAAVKLIAQVSKIVYDFMR